MTRKPGADQAGHPSAGPGGKAAERLRMFHEARGIPLEPVERYASDYSAAVLQAISAAISAGPGAAGGPQWRFLGPDLIPNGQSSVTARRVAVSGRVSAIAVDPVNRNHLLCGAALGGIWESFTRGADWAPRTDFMPTLTTGAIAFDPGNAKNSTNIVYAGTGEGDSYWYFGQGFLKSADGGTTWALLPGRVVKADGTLVTDKPFVGVGFFAIIVDPGDSQHILAATRGQAAVSTPATASAPAVSTPATGGVYESADGGTTWTQVYAARACWAISMQPGGCARQPDGSRAGEVLAATSDGLLRSGDGGHSWPVPGQPDPPGNPPLTSRVQFPGAPAGWTRLAVSISPNDPAVAYAFGASGDSPPTAYVWRRSSTGWSALAAPAPVDPVTGKADPKWTDQAAYDWYVAAAPGPFPAGTADQVYLGAKRVFRGDVAAAGGGWTVTDLSCKPQGDCIHDDQHAIAFDPADPAVIYCGCDGGVFRSPDRGVSWVPLNSGLGITEVIYTVLDNTTSRWLLAGTQDNGTLRYLGTSTFENVDDGDGGDCGIDQTRTPDPATGQLPPATCYDTFTYMWIERSTQGGARGTFQVITPKRPAGYTSLFYPPVGVSGTTVAIAGQSVFISRDTGSNWAPQVILPGSTLNVTALYLPSPDLVYAATFSGRVYKITYAGGAWAAAPRTTPCASYVSAIKMDPAGRIWATMTEIGNGQVFRSGDDGQSWADMTGNLPALPITSIAFDTADASGNRAWVSADVGVWQTTDGGTTWTPFFQNLPYVIVEDLEFHPATRVLRAATRSRGIWEATVDTPGSSAPPQGIQACSVFQYADGSLDVFCAGTDGTLGRASRSGVPQGSWSYSLQSWSQWASIGASLPRVTSAPAVAVAADQSGLPQVFARGTDGTLCQFQQAAGMPGTWMASSLGVVATGDPEVITRTPAGGSMITDVFARGTDGALWRCQVPGQGSTSLRLVISTAPAVTLNADGQLEVFACGGDGQLSRCYDAGGLNAVTWTPWQPVAPTARTAGRPVAALNDDGRMEIFARGTDGTLGHIVQMFRGDWSASAWESLGPAIAGDPAVARNNDGRLEVFARGTDGTLGHVIQTSAGGGWSQWESLGAGLSSDPAVVTNTDTRLEVFARGADGTLGHIYQTSPSLGYQGLPSQNWSQWQSLGAAIAVFT